MCGIVMMLSNDKLKGATARGKAFTQGIILDTLRGHHSTGLAYIDYDGNAEIYKKPVPGYDFVQMDKFKSILSDPEKYPIMIAHNRWATKGAVNTSNSHPFQHGNITGVHNGSLFSYKHLAPDEDFDTDSEHVIHSLANNGTAHTLGKIDGAAALVWHDAGDGTVHVVRNEERPFYIVHIKGYELVLGASEIEMLDLMCARNGLEIEDSYQVGDKNEFIFTLDDLHNPQMVEHEMEDVWSTGYGAGYYSKYNPYRANNYTPPKDKVTPVKLKATFSAYHTYTANTDYGYILGHNIDAPFSAVRINGIKASKWAAMDTKDGFFEGEVGIGGTDENGTVYDTIIQSTVEWFNWDEVYPLEYDDAVPLDLTIEEEEDDTSKKIYRNGNILYSKKDAERKISCGCGICGSPIPLQDWDDLAWWGESPICVDCDLGTAEAIVDSISLVN